MFFWRIFTFVKWMLLPVTIAGFIIAPQAFPVCLQEWKDGFSETFASYSDRGYFAPIAAGKPST